MFPLGTVLFPHALLPLHVFEPRYRLMTERVLVDGGEFGVVLIERGSEVGGGDVRFDLGTVARIVRAQQLPDGGYALVTVGIRRIRVTCWLPDDPFPQAEVVDVDEDAGRRGRPRVAGPGRGGARPRCVRCTGAPIRGYRSSLRSPIGPTRRRTRSRRWHRSARSMRSVCWRRSPRASASRCSPSCSTSTPTSSVPRAISAQ